MAEFLVTEENSAQWSEKPLHDDRKLYTMSEITQTQKASLAGSSVESFWDNRWRRKIDLSVVPLSRARPITADACSPKHTEGGDGRVDGTLEEEDEVRVVSRVVRELQ